MLLYIKTCIWWTFVTAGLLPVTIGLRYMFGVEPPEHHFAFLSYAIIVFAAGGYGGLVSTACYEHLQDRLSVETGLQRRKKALLGRRATTLFVNPLFIRAGTFVGIQSAVIANSLWLQAVIIGNGTISRTVIAVALGSLAAMLSDKRVESVTSSLNNARDAG